MSVKAFNRIGNVVGVGVLLAAVPAVAFDGLLGDILLAIVFGGIGFLICSVVADKIINRQSLDLAKAEADLVQTRLEADANSKRLFKLYEEAVDAIAEWCPGVDLSRVKPSAALSHLMAVNQRCINEQATTIADLRRRLEVAGDTVEPAAVPAQPASDQQRERAKLTEAHV